MKLNVQAGIIIAAAIFTAFGCSGSKKKVVDAAHNYVEAQENLRFDNDNYKKQVFDMSGDNQVDLWKFYQYHKLDDTEGLGELMIVRKEIDVNFDGRVDRIMFYNEKEELSREDVDEDFDGTIDKIHYYKSGLLSSTEIFHHACNRMEIDSQYFSQMKPDRIKYYRDGIFTREEVDDQCTGTPTSVTLYNAAGEVISTGEDTNHDGMFDIWTRY